MRQHKQYKPRQISYDVDVIVSYVPFPDEKRREEAYDTHARLFLKAKERMLKMEKAESRTTGNNKIQKAYKVVDEVIQEVMLAEEESLGGIRTLLAMENAKFNSEVIKEIVAILKQWNKIPANEIKAKVEAIKYHS